MVTGCASISTFISLVGIPIKMTSSVVKIKTCAVSAGILKKKKKHDKISKI